MDQYDRQLLNYLVLAEISAEKKQTDGCHQFLLLAGIAACQTGSPQIAAQCREIVLKNNPHHFIGSFPSLPAALQETTFQPFHQRLKRFCNPERSEHLVTQWNRSILPAGITENQTTPNQTTEQSAHAILAKISPPTIDE